MTKTKRNGFTIIELLVVVSIIALLIGILLPALGRARDSALQSTSLSNLRQISAGYAAYAGDWNDRQPTLVPDDYCQSGDGEGSCPNYIANVGCPTQPILGWANFNGGRALWGYWIDGTPTCAGIGNCGNIAIAKPYSVEAGQVGFFRLINMKIFAQYMNDRFYDKVFYAPKDRRKIEKVQRYFDSPDEFNSENQEIEWSSYAYAASAMMASDPMVGADQGGRFDFTDCGDTMDAPCNYVGGFKSPPVAECSFPDLKLRSFEHSWLQNSPGDVNPLFNPAEEYYYNHGIQSAPCSLFFDGSVRVFSMREGVKSTERMERNGQCRLDIIDWGGNTYYQGQSYGFPEEETSVGVLTRGGIRGRDTVGME
jgi:prepilin-type N-terminal cleavage/methylation domain-containing protein